MSAQWLIPTFLHIGHNLLMALPGLTPWLLLPVWRLIHPLPDSPQPIQRAQVWLACMSASLAVLGGWVALTHTPLNPARLWPPLLAMALAGAVYIRFGGHCLAAFIYRIHRKLLTLAGVLALSCALFMLANVLMRHVFAIGFGWMREAVIYAYAACFMLGAAGTLANNGHVRIDIIRENLSDIWQARLEWAGSLFLLIPVMLLILHVYAPQLALAWGAGSGRLERSDEGDGLPLAFLFKTLIPIFAFTLMMQGWAIAWRSARMISRDSSL